MKSYSIILCACFIFFGCANHKDNFKPYKSINLESKQEGNVYYQSWVAGIQGGGSGINLFIAKDLIEQPLEAYFRGQKSNLTYNNGFFIARYKTLANQEKDYVMDEDPVKEFKNQLPQKKDNFFHLKDNEVIISCIIKGKEEFILLKNITEKPSIAYPSIKK